MVQIMEAIKLMVLNKYIFQMLKERHIISYLLKIRILIDLVKKLILMKLIC